MRPKQHRQVAHDLKLGTSAKHVKPSKSGYLRAMEIGYAPIVECSLQGTLPHVSSTDVVP